MCEATLSHHRESVWDVRAHGGRLVSCGADGNVAVLSLDRGRDFRLLLMVRDFL